MSKNNLELVSFLETKIGGNYMYSGKGEVLTKERLEQVKNTYGASAFPDNSYYEKTKEFIGTTVRDCSGLIYEYTGKYLNSSSLLSQSSEKGDISTLHSAPIGVGLYFPGHVAVYIGNINGSNYIIEASGTFNGVIKRKIYNSFTHWFKIPNIDYLGDDDVELIQRPFEYNGKVKQFECVNINGTNYIKSRDLAELLNKEVTYEANTKTTSFKDK